MYRTYHWPWIIAPIFVPIISLYCQLVVSILTHLFLWNLMVQFAVVRTWAKTLLSFFCPDFISLFVSSQKNKRTCECDTKAHSMKLVQLVNLKFVTRSKCFWKNVLQYLVGSKKYQLVLFLCGLKSCWICPCLVWNVQHKRPQIVTKFVLKYYALTQCLLGEKESLNELNITINQTISTSLAVFIGLVLSSH